MLLSAALANASAETGSSVYAIVSALLALAAFAAYVVVFVLAAKTRKLGVLDYVVGSLGLFCGVGFFYFLWRANTVTLQHSFDLINQGGDPAESRALNKRFKIAAGVAIALGVVSYVRR